MRQGGREARGPPTALLLDQLLRGHFLFIHLALALARASKGLTGPPGEASPPDLASSPRRPPGPQKEKRDSSRLLATDLVRPKAEGRPRA